MPCDMCGAEGKLYKTIVEGAELILCHDCSKFGKVVGVVQQTEHIAIAKTMHMSSSEIIELVIDGYAEAIKEKRERLGLTQKEFAQKLNEKESVIQKIESGHFDPPIGMAKKIGKILKINLVEEHEEQHEGSKKNPKAESFTIGDFIKIKK